MRDIRNAPVFLRLGSRLRGPAGIPVGTLKRVLRRQRRETVEHPFGTMEATWERRISSPKRFRK